MTIKDKKLVKYIGLLTLTIFLTACSTGSREVSNQMSNHEENSTSSDIISSTAELDQSIQEELIRQFQEFQQALVDVDMEKIDAILPDDYIARHITGRTQTKEEWMADIESGQMVYYEFLDVSYDFSQEGETVILSVSQRIHANIYGSEGTWSIPTQASFQLVDGQWQRVK